MKIPSLAGAPQRHSGSSPRLGSGHVLTFASFFFAPENIDGHPWFSESPASNPLCLDHLTFIALNNFCCFDSFLFTSAQILISLCWKVLRPILLHRPYF